MGINTEKYLTNPILKNIFLLFTGTGIAQIIPVIASLFLSRIYTPTDFGDLSLIISVSTIVGSVAALRYEWVIILQKKIAGAKKTMALSFSLIALFSLSVFILFILLSPFLNHIFVISDYSLLFYAPVIIACIAIYNVFDNWFNRQCEFKTMAYLKIIQSSSISVLRVLLGLLGISWGLIAGTVIGYLVTILTCICLFLKKECFSVKYFSINKMKDIAVLYCDFFMYATPSGLLNSLSLAGLPILIVYFYLNDTAGLYFFANNLIGVPISFLSNAMSQVFKKEAVILVYSNRITDLNKLIHKFQQSIFFITLVFIFVLSLFGGDIFSFLFGSHWQESGEMIKFFSFYLMIGTYFSIISALIDILRLQKVSLFFNAFLLLFQVAIFAICSLYLKFEYTLLVNSIVGSLLYLILDRYVKNRIKKLANETYKYTE